MNERPSWIQLGETVAYYPNGEDGPFHVGVVDSRPRLLGGQTWVVTLRDMDPTYRDGQRRTVPAAACSHLKPYDLTEEYARLRLRESVMREALERIRATVSSGDRTWPAIWDIANQALESVDALSLPVAAAEIGSEAP